ncbi:MAG: zinc ribbon domain-containing protein [Acidobacteriota bacterium]|nr:zinc ribbon domain-containing protein [Acidobacteriota bacterium]
MDSRYYPGVEADVQQLAAELRRLFDEGDYEVQTMQVSQTAVLQARKSSTLRDLTGLSSALTIKITPEHGGTRVEIGMQKWFDKAAVAAVAVFFSAGMLLALPALGAYWQYKMTEDAWKAVEAHIARKAGGYVPPLPGRCGTCGAANVAGSDYCSSCGATLSPAATCDNCGARQNDSGARFCNRCGKPLGGKA